MTAPQAPNNGEEDRLQELADYYDQADTSSQLAAADWDSDEDGDPEADAADLARLRDAFRRVRQVALRAGRPLRPGDRVDVVSIEGAKFAGVTADPLGMAVVIAGNRTHPVLADQLRWASDRPPLPPPVAGPFTPADGSAPAIATLAQLAAAVQAALWACDRQSTEGRNLETRGATEAGAQARASARVIRAATEGALAGAAVPRPVPTARDAARQSYTALSSELEKYLPGVEPLTDGQKRAVGRWLHALADEAGYSGGSGG